MDRSDKKKTSFRGKSKAVVTPNSLSVMVKHQEKTSLSLFFPFIFISWRLITLHGVFSCSKIVQRWAYQS